MKILKKISIITLIVLISLTVIFFGMWVYFARSLDVSKITDITQTVDIMDKYDSFITGVYSKENRSKIEIENLPDHVKNAFIAIEDERFYKHIGVDVRRIFGAALVNVKSGGKQEGASTITQQLIKLSHLSSQKTFSRKIKEAFLALELERRYSKNEILEMYLNYCYFGNGAYGIEAGAKRYFGVNAKDLTIAQSAMLAGILKSPSKYAPHIKPEESVERRNLVLKQMFNTGFISNYEYDAALAEPVDLVPTVDEIYPYGYYIDTVLYEAEHLLGVDSEELLKEGYSIYTSLDTSIQQSLENAAKSELPENENGEIPEVAMVALTSQGEITGIVGGKEHTARRGINRAMDNKRSPGSTIKPVLVYAPAYEQKAYTNATFILDEKQSFSGYSPSNSSNKYYGWVTAKKAIAMSLNTPAVRTLNEVGVENAKNYGKSVGLEFEPEDDHLALALGGFSKGVTPLQMSASYLPFMNGGYYYSPSSVRKIIDKEGNIVYERQNSATKVLSEETAFLLTDVMKEVINSGTGKRLKNLNMNIAAKTGTSNIQDTSDSRDAWIVSYSTDYICTAWIGYDNGKALPSGVSGGSYPAHLVEQFYLDVYKYSKPEDFVKPEGVVEVKLDKTMLEKNKKVAIASEYAPDSQVLKEYFSIATVPSEHSKSWQKITSIDGFNITMDETGYPVISFKSEYSNINYTIMRIGPTGQMPVYQTSGQQKIISFKDTTVSEDEKYEYYIIAMIGDETIESQKIVVKTKKIDLDNPLESTQDNETKSEDLTSSSDKVTDESVDEENTDESTDSPPGRKVGTRKRRP